MRDQTTKRRLPQLGRSRRQVVVPHGSAVTDTSHLLDIDLSEKKHVLVRAAQYCWSQLRSKTVLLYKLVKKQPKRRLQIAATLLFVLLGTWAFMTQRGTASSESSTNQTTGGSTRIPGTLVKGTPMFDTLLPNNKSIEDLGGWTRLSPPDRSPVFVYVDYIGAITIRVSQQPLPDNLKKDMEKELKLLAEGFGATEQLSAGRTKVYLGQDVKGPQSVIFVKGDLLILITSSAPIEDEKWKAYVEELSPA